MRSRGVLGVVIAAAALALPSSAGAAPPPNVPWPSLLPPLPSPSNVQPHDIPACPRATIACVDRTIAHLDSLRVGFGCDHRAIFATTYERLTQVFRTFLVDRPRYFRYRSWILYEDALFAAFYYRTIADYAAGRPVPAAWKTALDTATKADAGADQDLLLGINAHVQRDMPYVLAMVGLRTRQGASRKGDHDRVNEVLAHAYGPIVDELAARYDPSVGVFNSPLTPFDDIAGLELVKVWREGVWRNAERLLNAKTEAQRSAVSNEIEANAQTWAALISAPSLPGYRAQRDAYCAAHLRDPV